MKSSLVISLAVLGLAHGQSANKRSRAAAVIPNRFIIELGDPEGLVKRSTDDGQNEIDKLFTDLSELNVTATASLNYTSDVLVGTAVTLTNDTDVEAIVAKLPQVERIWPVYQLSLPEPINGKVVSEPPTEYNVHIQTGVQKLHDEGIYGEGIIVAIVDSGVDWSHPYLGSGFGQGFKIESGWDFRGDEYYNEPDKPDNDPFDNCDGHGTHVTGIIAGNGTNFMGVAPAARIRVYKVASCYDGGMGLDILIAAHLRAYKDGADIISTSIGDETSWPSNLWAKTSSRIAKKGTFVISAAGNSGQNGPFLSSGQSTGEEIIAVGASHASQLPAIEAIVTDSKGVETKIAYLTSNALPWDEQWPNPNWETHTPLRTGVKLWSPRSPENTNPNNTEGCDELHWSEATQELKDRIVLVRRSSSCSLAAMGRALVQRGAWFMLVINDEKAPFIPIFGWEDPLVQPGMVSQEVGMELERRLANNETLTIRFPESGPIYGFPNLPVASTVDYYSSWGLANDLSVKPDIAAPGSEILSTYPVELGSYLIASGTSMATPYLAGVVALKLSASGGGRSKKGKSDLRDIARSLVNCGTPAPWVDIDYNVDASEYAPIAQQGGGIIDAYKFVHSNVLFNPNKLALNHTGNLQTKFKITVTNSGSDTIRFNVTHKPAGTFYTYGEDHLSIETNYPSEMLKGKAATAKFSTTYLEIAAGGKKSVEVDFTPPTGFVIERVPIYGGYVVFKGQDDDSFHVPYSGMATDARQIYEPTSQGGVFYLASTLADISAPTTVNLTTETIVAEFDLHFGVREAIVELIQNSTYTSITSETFKLPRVPGKNGFVGTLAANYALGRTTAYKAPERLWSGRQFLNGTVIPEGTYRYVLRILKPFRDGNVLDDWSWLVSQPVTGEV